jgi:uncharacterized damage-inducible protein DinB
VPAKGADKETLHRYLRRNRSALLAKLDGLDERRIRWPYTPTGTNLLGLVKHVASVQSAYFGEVFGRPFEGPYPWLEADAPADSDMFAALDESVDDIVSFHHASAEHADATISALGLDAEGSVPWWPAERRAVTLHQILVHMVAETARHAGHADIVREMLDGRAGDDDGNLVDRATDDWTAYRTRLIAIAENAR